MTPAAEALTLPRSADAFHFMDLQPATEAIVRERPIAFNCAIGHAVLAGAKMQTWRAKALEYFSQPENDPGGWWCPRLSDGVAYMVHKQSRHERAVQCPYGLVGDRLSVREPWRSSADLGKHMGSEIADLCLDVGYNVPWPPIQ